MVFGTALSGIQASTQDLDTIGNNIANSSTYGFKSSRAEFVDVYSAGAFGGGANQAGSGVRLSQIQQSFGQGHLGFTGQPLDLGITGGGFFVLSDNGSRLYSRAGAFHISEDGYIENAQHQRLQGVRADNFGSITNAFGDLQVSKQNILPQATTQVKAGLNFNSKTTPVGFDWVGGAQPSVNSYNNVTSSTIFDSLGNSHDLTMYFIKANADPLAPANSPNASSPPGTDNQWYLAFQIDKQNVPANVGVNNTDNLFRINFGADGTFTNVSDVTNTAISSGLLTINQALSNGANPLNFTLDLTTCSQFGSPFAVQTSSQDGYTTGQLDGINIGDNGIVFGRYTNGQSKAMGQIELADFASTSGLQPLGNSVWAETSSSGQAVISKAGTAGLGLIKSSVLEDSNVDLTGELVKLISAQRNFQANAQTIKTADAITQTIINIR